MGPTNGATAERMAPPPGTLRRVAAGVATVAQLVTMMQLIRRKGLVIGAPGIGPRIDGETGVVER